MHGAGVAAMVSKRRRVYHGIGLACVVLWLGLIGVVVAEHYIIPPAVRLEQDYMSVFTAERDEWSGIYFQGAKVGHAHSTIARIEDGFQISEDLHLNLTVLNVPQVIQTSINAVTDRDLRLSIFSFRLKAGVIRYAAFGRVSGTTVKLRVTSGSSMQRHRIELERAPVLSNSLKYLVLRNGLEPGTRFTQTFFDPLTLRTRAVDIAVQGMEKITVQGRQFDCYKVQATGSGVPVHSWLDRDGNTLREESPMGFVLVRESRADALAGTQGDSPDVAAATAVAVDRTFSKAGLRRLRLRLRNIDTSAFQLDQGRQHLSGDELTIQLQPLTEADTCRLPVQDARFAPDLADTVFIQSRHERVRRQAEDILQGERDGRRAVEKLLRWVYRSLAKEPTMSIPSAVQVLETRRGDCNEHAVLMAALCRAAGIPARLCAGLVYMNGSFYYHAWVEVYLGRWVPADPTLDQLPADVTHIKFVQGDLEAQVAILQLLGRLEIDVLECT